MSKASDDVFAERQRQIEVEGWSPEHDGRHMDGSLAAAGACYALRSMGNLSDARRLWPRSWDFAWLKPDTRRRCLVKAAALLIAEIERLDRMADANAEHSI